MSVVASRGLPNFATRNELLSHVGIQGRAEDSRYLLYPKESKVLLFLFSSDEFIQAQQQLARWASEDAVGQPGTSGAGVVGGAPVMVPREYFPSPSSSTSEEPTSIVRAPAPAPPIVAPAHPEHATIHRPKRYPEYKH